MSGSSEDLRVLEELFTCGIIQPEEYSRRKALLEAETSTLFRSSSTSIFDNGFQPAYNEPELDLSAFSAGGTRPAAGFEDYGVPTTSSFDTNTGFNFPAATPESMSEDNTYTIKPPLKVLQGKVKKNQRGRKIRLFVSSTFRDMQKERDLLMKKVVPELKKTAASRGVDLVAVDFRWGITAEQTAKGKTLSLCFKEIDKCRPYFIGMIGERYGWANIDGIKDKGFVATIKKAADTFPWVTSYKDRSVTELEMLYGALFYPELASSHSFFYLRDKSYVDSIPQQKRSDYLPVSEARRQKVESLKLRIKDSKLPMHENYKNPQEFALLVLADMKSAIERDFPINDSALNPLEYENRAITDFAQRRAKVYIGRNEYQYVLKTHIEGRTTVPLIVTGDKGAGKTSFVGNWLSMYGDSDPVIVNFIGLTTTDIRTIIRRVLGTENP